MKRTCGLALALLAGTAAAWADSNDLTGGVLITHHAQSLTYTTDVADWAAAYAPYGINNSQDQKARIDGPLDNSVWFVLAAWDEPKAWKGVEFGFANYTASLFGLYASGPCYPASGGLEIPTAGWPGPNEGTAFVATGSGSWSGNYVPVYYFAGYAYGAALGSTIIQIGIDPPNNTVELSNIQSPPQIYPITPANRGGLGINTDGVEVHPVYVAPERACCNPTTHACTIQTEADCATAGGVWKSNVTTCTPNPCIPTGACCWGSTVINCSILSEADCSAKPHPLYSHGVWKGEAVPCEPYPCTVLQERVCCLPDHSCQVLNSFQCTDLGGTWHDHYESCADAHCDALGACCVGTTCTMAWEAECKVLNGLPPTQPFVPGHVWHPSHTCDGLDNPCYGTPVKQATWGRIKALYR
jgi:hypothetical protein